MAETQTEKSPKLEPEPFLTKASVTRHVLRAGKERFAYEALADWITLRKKHRPAAKMFNTAYFRLGLRDRTRRPITFVFNGGPGASSAYLHMGAVGPRRVAFGKMGTLPPPPVQLVDNQETWLTFSDLVFVDPVGTGFSRPLDAPKKDGRSAEAKEKEGPPDDKENPEYWEPERDLDSLGEFIQTFLSKHKRWTSPVFLAGESYGGFRVAKMVRRLQERYGVGLNGAILISPAIEFDSLLGSDYSITRWMEFMPSQAAVAHFHGRCRAAKPGMALEKVLTQAEAFARTDLLTWLARGEDLGPQASGKVAETLGAWIGIPGEVLERAGGRIGTDKFCRLLLREERKLVGRYDGSITTLDPYPDRDHYAGPDPTLCSIDRLFTGGINQHLRSTLAVETELDYRTLSMEVNEAWRWSDKYKYLGVFQSLGALEDLRYGMSLNSHMKVFLTHGYFDLVTPYFSSNRLVGLMKLPPKDRERLTVRHFLGGHMFYSWDESRKEFHAAMGAFYRSAT